jgi:hypothetical protein
MTIRPFIRNLAMLVAGSAAAQTPATIEKPAKPAAAKPARTWTVPRTADGQPDFQGVWNNGTITRLERPADLAGKEFFTPKEALEYEKTVVERTNRDQRTPGTEGDVSRAYNDAWWDSGTKVIRTLRTSMVIDPPDGRLPPLTPQAQALLRSQAAGRHPQPWGPEDRSLQERCLMFPTDSVPMLPYVYNNNFRIVQTKDTLAIYIEMIHDVRTVYLDGRPHLPSTIRRWLGDSRGHWEGDTLVVDNTNFNGKNRFSFNSPVDQNLHVVERFTRSDRDTLVYRFTVEDPTVYTKPWTAETTLSAAPGPIYEYACHEGNYGMMNLLSGARAEEKAAQTAK